MAALESSTRARKRRGKEAREETYEVSTKYCSNLLKMSTLAIISVIAIAKLQIVYDLEQDRGNIQSLLNLTLESRNSGYALVHRDKANVKKPTLVSLMLCGFGMGPAFSSDIAGDGPVKRAVSDDEYHPELIRIKKRKT